jgi:hypothetical protein
MLMTGSVFMAYTPTAEKKIENIASMTMTRKIDMTTARVVCRPTLSALPRTFSSSRQPIRAIAMPKTGAFMIPTQKA